MAGTWTLRFALSATLILMSSGCATRSMLGVDVETAFADPLVVELAGAACAGNSTRVRAALAKGADPNTMGFQGVTPLNWTIACQNPDGVRALLVAGADPNRIGDAGYSATFQAAGYEDVRVLEALLQGGGDPNLLDREGETALRQSLSLGMQTGNWDNWHLLLASGVDVNRADRVGHTIATETVVLAQFERTVELLEAGYSYELGNLHRLTQSLYVTSDFQPSRRRVLQEIEKRLRE